MKEIVYIRAEVMGELPSGQKIIHLLADNADGISFATSENSILRPFTGLSRTEVERRNRISQLPCKIGDIVWQLNRYNANITPKVVSQIVHTISKSGESVEIWFETAGRCRGSDFGKTVFCDKAEAMQAFTKYSSEGDT